jgi:hypothetical protein
MKKAILAFAVVSVSFVACNNGDDKKVEETKTSDTSKVVTKDTAMVVKDTTVKTTTTIDTMKKK